MLWRHVVINTKSSWLHGDRRGFRSRNHRIHSSGDYKNPPPPTEHVRLHDYQRKRAQETVVISRERRVDVLRELVARFRKEGFTILCAAVTDKHAHALVELPDHRPTIKQVVGRAKRYAGDRSGHVGAVWSAGGTFEPVDTPAHHRRVYAYIYDEQGKEAASWSYKREDEYRAPPGRHPGRR